MVLSPAAAQKTVFLTPRAGLNLANITSAGGNLRPGLNFGLSGEYLLARQWSAEAGLFYSMEGSQLPSPHLSPDLGYLCIPIEAKFYLTDGYDGTRGFFFHLGPQFNFALMRDKINYTAGHEQDDDLLTASPTKGFAFSIVAGLGYLFPVGFQLSLNLDEGLSNINRMDSGYRNYVVQMNFGYRFSL
ncbi:MAG: PorT family protein [Tannerella sp.]|jgi:hypothetical protein|nr:PorT family protein [Tannerella sp.]